MFKINEDMSIYVTRGDYVLLEITAHNDDGSQYTFKPGEIVEFKVTEKKACENVVLYKKIGVEKETDVVEILLTEEDTKIGDVISKPVDYWYEIELGPNKRTLLGYDEENGAKIFRLFPEGNDVESTPVTPEDIPVVDKELDLTSDRPVQNQAVAREFALSKDALEKIAGKAISNEEKLAAAANALKELSEDLKISQEADEKALKELSEELKTSIVAENLIPYPYHYNSGTNKGITFTDNGDGSVTLNGTATEQVGFYLTYATSTLKLQENTFYTLSGCPAGGSVDTYGLEWVSVNADDSSDWNWGYGADYGEGLTQKATIITNSKDLDVFFRITVKGGTTVNNLTFKPMFEVGTIAHDYVPYKFSRASLRNDLDNIDMNANKVAFDDTIGIGADDTQSAIEKVFQYGNNRKAEAVNSLKHSGLGLTVDNTWDEIFAVLAEAFPEKLVLYEVGKYPEETLPFKGVGNLIPVGVTVSGTYATPYISVYDSDAGMRLYWGNGTAHGAVISDEKINVTSYKSIKIAINLTDSKNMEVLCGVLYSQNSADVTTVDESAITFDLNKEVSLDGIEGEYYIGIFGCAYYTGAYVPEIVLTAYNARERFELSFETAQEVVEYNGGYYMTLDTYGDNWKVSDDTTSNALVFDNGINKLRLFYTDDYDFFRAMSMNRNYVFEFTAPASGDYNLVANAVLAPSHGKADIYVNDTFIKTIDMYGSEQALATIELGKATLEKGEYANKIRIYTSGKSSGSNAYAGFTGFTFKVAE